MMTETLLPSAPEHNTTLRELGLETDWLREFGERVLTEFNSATPNDAVNAAGSYAYFAGVRAIRDILAPHGWKPLSRDCYEEVWEPDSGVAIYAISGNKNTGIEGPGLRTKNPRKGKQAQRLIDRNNEQLPLPFWPDIEPSSPNSEQKVDTSKTWFLLYYIDKDRAEMRMEIALPISMTSDETNIEGWAKRIFLPPVSFSPAPIAPENDFAPDIEFEIKRRV